MLEDMYKYVNWRFTRRKYRAIEEAKVLEYFASLKSPTGERFMTPADLMRAVVSVFPPSEANCARDGYLKGESVPGELRCSSFKVHLFVTLLSIPESSFSVGFKMFDLDNNGNVSCNEKATPSEQSSKPYGDDSK
ncbi:hypothetical protein RJ640_002935 [Escallonia rubra]|uniref:EF-hand domain-containing protein n=1 Tax=Escallonia rubra TaxID=112253 RepID=A0AA88UA21_9ASTE|nr:hypothetical protein RJ640_002935 [Escallonia rubra]